MGTRWRGMLAPLDTSTGDGRRIDADGVTCRQLPLALKWQRPDETGHDNSVIIGSLDVVNIGTVADAIDGGWIDAATVADQLTMNTVCVWGHGELFDDADPNSTPHLAEDVAEALLLTGKKVIGPSCDAGAAEAVYVPVGGNEPLTEEQYWQAWEETGEEPAVELLFTAYEIAAATLVAIPAFAECRPFELDQPALTAAVRSSGWDDIPLADRDTAWDGAAAEQRIADDSGIGGDNPDWDSYAAAFLYVDAAADPETKGAYSFPIVDLIDGDRRIVYAAVSAVAAVLDGSRGGTTIPDADAEAMRGVVEHLYERMASEWNDDTVVAPWLSETARKRKCAAQAALIAAVSRPTGPTYDPAWFDDPNLDQLTPLTVAADGRIYGHIATHTTCHVGIRDECVTAPVDDHGYAAFNRYPIDTTAGMLAVGRITTGHGRHRCRCGTCRGTNDDHACVTLTAAGAMAHHDQLTTLAWVRAGEDTRLGAIWVAGVLAVDCDTQDRARLAAGVDVSGDWRTVTGRQQLVEVLALDSERPGFPLPRMAARNGQVMALTAAGAIPRRRTPTSLAAQIAEELTAGPALARFARAVGDHLTAATAGPGPDPSTGEADPPPDAGAPALEAETVQAATGAMYTALAAAYATSLEQAVA